MSSSHNSRRTGRHINPLFSTFGRHFICSAAMDGVSVQSAFFSSIFCLFFFFYRCSLFRYCRRTAYNEHCNCWEPLCCFYLGDSFVAALHARQTSYAFWSSIPIHANVVYILRCLVKWCCDCWQDHHRRNAHHWVREAKRFSFDRMINGSIQLELVESFGSCIMHNGLRSFRWRSSHNVELVKFQFKLRLLIRLFTSLGKAFGISAIKQRQGVRYFAF